MSAMRPIQDPQRWEHLLPAVQGYLKVAVQGYLKAAVQGYRSADLEYPRVGWVYPLVGAYRSVEA